MSTSPIEHHFSYPFLNSVRRNRGRRMLYNDVNDLRQAFAAPATAPPTPVAVPTAANIGGGPSMGSALGTPGPSVRGPPISQPIPMMPPIQPQPPKTGILDKIKAHPFLVIGAVLAILLIIGIIWLLLRKKGRGNRKK